MLLSARGSGGPVWLEPALTALNRTEAWAIAKPILSNPAGPHVLWHTSDGGESWHEIWAKVAGPTRARDLRFFGPNVLR